MRHIQKEATVGGGKPPLVFSAPTIRLYTSDVIILSLLERNRYGYSRTIAKRLNRSHRTITKHLHKLERLQLVQRHGRIRCCFTWWSVNESAREPIRELIKVLWTRIKGLAVKAWNYLTARILLAQVRKRPVVRLQLEGWTSSPIAAPREYHGDERPAGASIPYKCYCERGGACPFPVCIKHQNPRDRVGAALIKRAREFYDGTLFSPG